MSLKYDRDSGKLVNLTTQSNIQVKSFYRPEDIKALDYEKDLGDPGEYPFTRGIFPNM